MRATMPGSWIRYFDARFHPNIVSLSDLYARGWSKALVHRHLGFSPSVKGVIRSEEISDVKSARGTFLREQARARPQETELALAMIEKAKESFRSIEISADEAIERGYQLNLHRLKEEKPDIDDLPSKKEWLKQGDTHDGWHWPAFWIGHSIGDRHDELLQLTENEGITYACACISMLDAIDCARKFAAVPGAIKWFWCEWTRSWKDTRPADCDPRWGDDDILPPYDRDVVKWPYWPQDLHVIPPCHRD